MSPKLLVGWSLMVLVLTTTGQQYYWLKWSCLPVTRNYSFWRKHLRDASYHCCVAQSYNKMQVFSVKVIIFLNSQEGSLWRTKIHWWPHIRTTFISYIVNTNQLKDAETPPISWMAHLLGKTVLFVHVTFPQWRIEPYWSLTSSCSWQLVLIAKCLAASSSTCKAVL